MIAKYFKYHNNLVVKWVKDNPNGFFTGVVVFVGGSGWQVGDKDRWFPKDDFTEYEPTPKELVEWGEIDLETTQPDPTPDKDTELRLECLKLASNNKNGQSTMAILELAEHYYDWITKQ